MSITSVNTFDHFMHELPINPTPHLENEFFDHLMADATRSIFEFLENGSKDEDKQILSTALVCKTWKNNPFLIAERKEASARLAQRINIHNEMAEQRQYPKEMLELFRQCRSPITQLPILDLSKRRGDIALLKVKDMSHPVMRFKDKYRRPGIALHIQGFGNEMAPVNWRGDEQRLKNIKGVLTIFKRYSDSSPNWTFAWDHSNGGSIQTVYDKRHNENGHVGPNIIACPSCPFQKDSINDQYGYVHETILRNLLTGQDPIFMLPGHHAAPVDPSAASSSPSLFSRIINGLMCCVRQE